MQVDVSQIRKGDGRWIFLTSDVMNEFPEHFTEFEEGLRRHSLTNIVYTGYRLRAPL